MPLLHWGLKPIVATGADAHYWMDAAGIGEADAEGNPFTYLGAIVDALGPDGEDSIRPDLSLPSSPAMALTLVEPRPTDDRFIDVELDFQTSRGACGTRAYTWVRTRRARPR